MHFVLHAYDYADDEGLDRRMAVRPLHFEGVHRLKESGRFVLGGALLSPEGKMIGSMMVIDFPDLEGLEAWLQSEPYVTGRVWETIDIKPFLMAQI